MDPTQERAAAVVDCAITWWGSKRPLTFSRDDHHSNPTVNCTSDAEKWLARAVSEWLNA